MKPSRETDALLARRTFLSRGIAGLGLLGLNNLLNPRLFASDGSIAFFPCCVWP